MVIKVIFIIIAIVYYLYSKGKKAQEQEQQQRRNTTSTNPYGQSQQPKNEKTIDEILRDLQQQIETANQPQVQYQPQPKQDTITYTNEKQESVTFTPVAKKDSTQYTSASTDILLHERKLRDMAYEEGKGNYEPTYERDLTDEEKIERGNLKLQNEGAYKIETEEEIAAHTETYIFDARQALIGSVVLERPYK